MRKTMLITAFLCAGAFLYAGPGLFPGIDGWKLQEENTVFTPDNLWEEIDGAAELYLAYNFRELHQAFYTDKNDREVKVEIYRHDTPVNTYGIYTAERMPDYTFIETGVQGYTSTDILNFFTGCYYVKLTSYGQNATDEETLKTIAGEVSRHLSQPGSWPPEVSLFPAEGKLPMTDGYVASDFLGYSFLQSAFTARYDAGGEFTLFLIHGKPGEAAAMLERYLAMVKEDKVKQDGNVYVVQDLFNGTIILSGKGDYLAGAVNAADGAKATECIGKMLAAITEE